MIARQTFTIVAIGVPVPDYRASKSRCRRDKFEINVEAGITSRGVTSPAITRRILQAGSAKKKEVARLK